MRTKKKSCGTLLGWKREIVTMLIAVSRLFHKLQLQPWRWLPQPPTTTLPTSIKLHLAVEVGIENVSLLSRHEHLELVSRPSIIIASALADYTLSSTPPFKPALLIITA